MALRQAMLLVGRARPAWTGKIKEAGHIKESFIGYLNDSSTVGRQTNIYRYFIQS